MFVNSDWQPFETCPQDIEVIVIIYDGQLNPELYPVVRHGDNFYFVDSIMGNIEVYPDVWKRME